MQNLPISPVLVGRGMAGKAILQSLAILSQMDPELRLLPVRLVSRGKPLKSYLRDKTLNVLFLANPSGLRAKSIMEGIRAGFAAIAADKPVCVRREEIDLLQNIDIPVTVFHGYRATWGSRTIKRLIEAGELGEVFAFESRYWQSSSAQLALKGVSEKKSWKNDVQLNGPRDALTDLGSHVVDLCLYLMGDKPLESRCWLSYRNSQAPHRDSHIHLQLKFPDMRRAFASISKTVHGATNDLEYTVIGTRGSATWRFLHPDEVQIGSGSRSSLIRRETVNESSETAPFHGLGWLEGYVEITRQTLRRAAGLVFTEIPTLGEALDAMDVLLRTHIETQ